MHTTHRTASINLPRVRDVVSLFLFGIPSIPTPVEDGVPIVQLLLWHHRLRLGNCGRVIFSGSKSAKHVCAGARTRDYKSSLAVTTTTASQAARGQTEKAVWSLCAQAQFVHGRREKERFHSSWRSFWKEPSSSTGHTKRLPRSFRQGKGIHLLAICKSSPVAAPIPNLLRWANDFFLCGLLGVS